VLPRCQPVSFLNFPPVLPVCLFLPSSSSRMSDFSEEPRFTIEQIDLLQRLRRTGMTKQEILHALDTLDRLDREHGATCNGGEGGDHSSSSSLVVAAAVASSTTSKISTATQTQFNNSGGGLSPSPSNSYDTSPPPGPPPPSAVLAFGFEAAEEDLDVDDKVEELMRRDSSLVKEEIKAFLGNRRISQAVVAQVTGISQSRISHWLLQHGSDLSEQKKRAFYRWYILEKTTPGNRGFKRTPGQIFRSLDEEIAKLFIKKRRSMEMQLLAYFNLMLCHAAAPGATLNMRPAPLPLEEMEWRQTPPPLATAPGTFRLRRGSRFTWRKECLAVMESYFNDNQYPDEAKREEIANACNAVIQKPGKKLSDLERVTSLKVYNWFANRRKEIKRRANIEATILESHGIDVQSPGGHSNSDDIDGNDFAE
uniref:Homeobox-containing protein 1 n=1 Tax=Poecilia formosa TaxID=48698 RepID=A0A096MF55_POEFO